MRGHYAVGFRYGPHGGIAVRSIEGRTTKNTKYTKVVIIEPLMDTNGHECNDYETVRGWRAWARPARRNRRAVCNGSPLHSVHALLSPPFSLLSFKISFQVVVLEPGDIFCLDMRDILEERHRAVYVFDCELCIDSGECPGVVAYNEWPVSVPDDAVVLV